MVYPCGEASKKYRASDSFKNIPDNILQNITNERVNICRLSFDVRVMGILNVTPDSFSDGESTFVETAEVHLKSMISDGADIIDIGGESTRPGAVEVEISEKYRG